MFAFTLPVKHAISLQTDHFDGARRARVQGDECLWKMRLCHRANAPQERRRREKVDNDINAILEHARLFR